MSRRLAALVAVLWAVPATPAPKLKERPAATYWPAVPGTVLVYQVKDPTGTQTEKVTAVDRKGNVTTVTTEILKPGGGSAPGKKVEIRTDGVFLTEEVGQPYDPPVCVLKLPPKVGDTWETATRRWDTGPLKFVDVVVEAKTIEVPAGKFEAFKVVSEVTVVKLGAAQKVVYWYAKEVGVVQVDGVQVLKEVAPGK